MGDAPPQAAQFSKGALAYSDLSSDPFAQFQKWYANAEPIKQREACTLSTAQLPSGRVSARVVYLKELDPKGGFVIYSNFGTSHKAKDLETNKWGSLSFWWRDLERAVRIEGLCERLSNDESQVYYDTRIRGSRIGAWASEQSKILIGREELETRVNDIEKKFEGQDHIPVPDFWGGLRITPVMVEFWQGRESRLHDRFQYSQENGSNEWKIERLAP